MTNEMKEILDELNTIEERRDAIAKEVETAEASVLEERDQESKDLEMRKAELVARKEELEAEERAALKAKEEPKTAAEVEIPKEERKEMTVEEIRSSKEYINAYAEYVKTGNAEECRSILSENATTGGQVPVPTLVEDRVRTAWNREGIMSLVKKSFLKGNLKVGFEISATGAVIHAEGADAPDEEELTLGVVELVPASIKKWITISDECMDLKGEAFLDYIYDELAYQIAKKAADTLIAKIEAAGTTPTSSAVGVPVVSESTITVGTIAKAIAKLSDEASSPVIMMNKLTWADFKAAQYANGYGVDPFEGLPVLFNNTIEAYSAASSGDTYVIVGDLENGALANFPNGQEINFKFDDLSLAEADLVKVVGREFVGLGIVGPGHFVKIQK